MKWADIIRGARIEQSKVVRMLQVRRDASLAEKRSSSSTAPSSGLMSSRVTTRLWRRSRLAEHELVRGEVIFAELRRTLSTKFKLPPDRIEAVESVLASVPIIPGPAQPSELAIRDAADRWVLATAIAGDATVLVAGDRDLLDVRDGSPIPILDPSSAYG